MVETVAKVWRGGESAASVWPLSEQGLTHAAVLLSSRAGLSWTQHN